VVGAGLGLLILGPALLVLAILIRLDSPGSAIFTQQRMGRYGRVFTLYKFRSMQHGAPVQLNADGSTRVVDDDPRVTRLGHFLRRTAIDELPQLLNVLKGDMSLVGPRPDPAFYERYYHGNDYYKLTVRPGLTALAHVLGRQTIGWRDRFPIERVYVERLSPLLDIKIMLLTILVLWNNVGATNSARVCTSSAVLGRRVAALTHPARLLALRTSGKFLAAMVALVLLVPMLPTQPAHAVVRGPVKPVLECVAKNSDGTYTAWFGYDNRNDYQVDIAIGNRNKLRPAPQDRGQLSSFLAGRQRVVFAVNFTSNTLVWSLDGRTATASRNSSPCRVRPADFNDDMSVDLFWRHQVTGENGMWLLNGTERQSSIPLNTVDDPDWRIEALHDFDGNRKADVLWRHAQSGENVLWFMDDTARKGMGGINTVEDTDWRIVGLRDFDENRQDDILWRHSSTGGNIIWLMDGTNRTGLAGLNMVSDTNWHIMGLHDFDGDRQEDILWRHSSTGDNIIWFMDGTTRRYAYGTDRVSDQNWHISGVNDFNADGKADIVWRNTETGSNVLWLMDGSTVDERISLNTLSDHDWQMVSIDDFNKDGRADIFWHHRSSGANGIWCFHGGTRTAVVALNTVDDAAWDVMGTNVNRVETEGTPQLAHISAGDPQISLAAAESLMAGTPDEAPGAMMADEGISTLMPEEPLTALPDTMLSSNVYLPLIRR
jgi:lipopolysaccharide/colanic/teichoic acid biosynthesis glycosyltransferase